MADRKIILTLDPSEVRALSNLLSVLCRAERDENSKSWLTMFLGEGSNDVEEIGCINAALNANR